MKKLLLLALCLLVTLSHSLTLTSKPTPTPVSPKMAQKGWTPPKPAPPKPAPPKPAPPKPAPPKPAPPKPAKPATTQKPTPTPVPKSLVERASDAVLGARSWVSKQRKQQNLIADVKQFAADNKDKVQRVKDVLGKGVDGAKKLLKIGPVDPSKPGVLGKIKATGKAIADSRIGRGVQRANTFKNDFVTSKAVGTVLKWTGPAMAAAQGYKDSEGMNKAGRVTTTAGYAGAGFGIGKMAAGLSKGASIPLAAVELLGPKDIKPSTYVNSVVATGGAIVDEVINRDGKALSAVNQRNLSGENGLPLAMAAALGQGIADNGVKKTVTDAVDYWKKNGIVQGISNIWK